MGKNEGADELLSAFNVASFKSAEDDKAFWNRLIPVDVQNTETGKQQVRQRKHTSNVKRQEHLTPRPHQDCTWAMTATLQPCAPEGRAHNGCCLVLRHKP